MDGRAAEKPGARPLALETELGLDVGTALASWPRDHVVKVLCFAHPDDDAALWSAQLETTARLAEACRRNRLEPLLEPSRDAAAWDPAAGDKGARAHDRLRRKPGAVVQ